MFVCLFSWEPHSQNIFILQEIKSEMWDIKSELNKKFWKEKCEF